MEKKSSGTKKILIFTNVITLLLAGYFYYRYTQQTDTPQEIDPEKPAQLCSSYEDMKGETFDHFKDAVNRYYTFIYPAINRTVQAAWDQQSHAPEFKDARAIWFSLDSIKQFIYTVEKYSGYMNLPTSQLGIRFYYGQYNQQHSLYPDRHTLFLVPTFAHNANETAIDFDPRYNYQQLNVTDISNVKSLRTVAEGSAPATAFTILGSTDVADPSIRNSGELCPPKCVPNPDNTFLLTDH